MEPSPLHLRMFLAQADQLLSVRMNLYASSALQALAQAQQVRLAEPFSGNTPTIMAPATISPMSVADKGANLLQVPLLLLHLGVGMNTSRGRDATCPANKWSSARA